jgi:hypothetical protein
VLKNEALIAIVERMTSSASSRMLWSRCAAHPDDNAPALDVHLAATVHLHEPPLGRRYSAPRADGPSASRRCRR